jgi:hypothetical protein
MIDTYKQYYKSQFGKEISEREAEKVLKKRIKDQQDNYESFKDFYRKDATETYLDDESLKAGDKIQIDEWGRVLKINKEKGTTEVFAADADLLTLMDKNGNLLPEDQLLKIENSLIKNKVMTEGSGIEHGSLLSLRVKEFVHGKGYYSRYKSQIERKISKFAERISEGILEGKTSVKELDIPSEFANDSILKNEIAIIINEYKIGNIKSKKVLLNQLREKIRAREMAKTWYKIKNDLTKDGLKDDALVLFEPDGSLKVGKLEFTDDVYATSDTLFGTEIMTVSALSQAFMTKLEASDDVQQNSKNTKNLNKINGEWYGNGEFDIFVTRENKLYLSIGGYVKNFFQDVQYYGGIPPKDQIEQLIQTNGIQDIYSLGYPYAIVLNNGMFFIVPYDNDYDSIINPGGKVVQIASTGFNTSAIAVLLQNGTVKTYGSKTEGGFLDYNFDQKKDVLYNVKQIYSTDSAFAALTNDGTVYAWGDPRYGGALDYLGKMDKLSLIDNGLTDGIIDTLTNVKEIYKTNGAFAALTNDGSVVTWGDRYKGGLKRNRIKDRQTCSRR